MAKYRIVKREYKMKAYTDIEQSKVLAEILPSESADMYYMNGTKHVLVIPNYETDFFNLQEDDVPCWSLVALRACLPPGISIDGILYVFESHNTFDNEWVYEYKFEDISAPLYSKSSNEIDACYKMILKLHELKML